MSSNGKRRPLVTDGAEKIDQLRGSINSLNNRNIPGLQIAAPIRIDVKPTASGRKWRVSLDGKALGASTSPLVTAARYLIGKGVDPGRTVEMWHQHADAWALRGQIGAIAAVVLDGEKRPQDHARNGSCFGRDRARRVAGRCDHGHTTVNQIGHQCRQAIVLALQPVVLDRHVLAFDVAGFVEAFAERGHITRVGIGRPVSDKSDHRHLWLLRACSKWPRGRRTA
jgi:hypothetical protein